MRKTNGTYGLGVLVADFDNDGWPDIYVANDSAPAALYHNNKNGTFTDIGIEAGCAFSIDGKPQAGMGVSAGDYDRDGWLDIFKTNFSGDTSTLYRNTGKAVFDDVTFPAGIGINTRWLGWGCGFVDVDNNGWLDIFLVNGHVYPEVEKLTTEAGYAQRKVLYQKSCRTAASKTCRKAWAGPLSNLRPRAAALSAITIMMATWIFSSTRSTPCRSFCGATRQSKQLDHDQNHRREIEPQRDRRAHQVRHRRRQPDR